MKVLLALIILGFTSPALATEARQIVIPDDAELTIEKQVISKKALCQPAIDQGKKWPFVIIPHFSHRARELAEISFTGYITSTQ